MDETYSSSTVGHSQRIHLGEQRVLGVRWNVVLDHFVVNLDDIAIAARELQPTKRNVVSLVGKFYDPLRFLAPVVKQFKVFFKELCAAKLEWNQPLSGELLRRWHSWCLTWRRHNQSQSLTATWMVSLTQQSHAPFAGLAMHHSRHTLLWFNCCWRQTMGTQSDLLQQRPGYLPS